jgi:hypothetical protein
MKIGSHWEVGYPNGETRVTTSISEMPKKTKVINVTADFSIWEYITKGYHEAEAIRKMSMKVTSDFAIAGNRPGDVGGTEDRVRSLASESRRASSVRASKPRGGSGLGWRSPHAIIGSICMIAIAIGWMAQGETGLSPTDGLGYGLGIAGLSMMLLLLGYSVRKRARVLRRAGAMRTWFEAHLVLGLLGPTAILYHADFSLGSANATISLVCVLAVSGSGVGGRFLYGRMHRGLAGSRRSVKDIRKRARNALFPIEAVLESHPSAKQFLVDFETRATREARFPFRILSALRMRMRSWMTEYRVLRALRGSNLSAHDAVAARQAIAQNLAELCRASELRLFERLFALWHAVHVPLTIILFVSAVIHVIAVHLY